MKSKTYRELRERAYEYLTLNRFPNTNGHKEAKRFLKNLLREKSIPFWEEPFSVKKRVPIGASLEVEGKKVQAFPFVGSIGGSFEGYLKEDFIEGDIALQTAKGIDWNALKTKNIKVVVFVAHMDTKPKTQGAIDNGLASEEIGLTL
jgi:aminopeptidase YwaD